MAGTPSTPRRPPTGRRRGRPPGTTNAARAARLAAAASEPPPKKRKYIPGGPGGGGRFVDNDIIEVSADGQASASAPRPQPGSPHIYPRRERSTRIRTATSRYEPDDEHFSSAAAVAAAVVQSEGYKPREERGWEEFHPNLDIEATFAVFHAEDVDGITKSTPPTPAGQHQGTPVNGASTPLIAGSITAMNTLSTQEGGALAPVALGSQPGTPLRRRVGRPPRDPLAYYAAALTPRTPKVLPIHNQTPKERLDLKLPSYRKTDRILLFESKAFGQARYVDKAMMNVGYQESDNYIRPERNLIKASDANVEEEMDQAAAAKAGGESVQHTAGNVGRVEYDMDEQDDMWLETYNAQRKAADLEIITREIFEITITKIEKEWHALEKRIPKPNPKPPQTHRPRSSSAAAVNGETQAGEEQDSKCAICDDGDCENTNAIVFCDGCDLAVHQECYGVPFIPEGQWLCRKCQLIGRGIPACIFCPNADGAFKQTNSSKWAHLLCAMWIPEVSLGNHTFMEPVMDVDKVPKNRWRLTCYICQQRMGACIQCGNKACYQAFHVTCARRARLYLKMKNSQGALAVLDGSMILKAFCDKHSPPDYSKEHSVYQSTREARRFYKRTMRGRIWADSQASAAQIAATHRHAITEHPPDESQMTGAKLNAVLADKKKGQPGKPIWKLPSGAPVIPQAVFDIVESSLARFTLRKRKEFVAEACRYWTLKREARRGAALLKRLQLQMETFSSMELTRRNFAAMGPSGRTRLDRRVEFAEALISDLEQLRSLSSEVVERELLKLHESEIEQDFVDACYFPIYRLLLPVAEKAMSLDRSVFYDGLVDLQAKLEARFYTTTPTFAHDLCEVFHMGINTEPKADTPVPTVLEPMTPSTNKPNAYPGARDRKRLAKRMLKSLQPLLIDALRAEADISHHKPLETLLKELEGMLDASVELGQPSITVLQSEAAGAEPGEDVVMVDAVDGGQIIVADDGEEMDIDDADIKVEGERGDEGSIQVKTLSLEKSAKTNGIISSNASVGDLEKDGGEDQAAAPMTNGVKSSDTPPGEGGYAPVSQPLHPAPLTPPQSNGSLGRGPVDSLSDGGILWHVKGFSPQGTTAVEVQWAGRDAVRSLSEDLTDMDDEELNGLECDVEDNTITASPAEVDTDDSPSWMRMRHSNGKFRKGVRSSTRRR